MNSDNHINGSGTAGPGGYAFSFNGIPSGGPHSFSARDVLYTSVNHSNGIFVMMKKNFKEGSVSEISNEAIRYHKAVGLGHADNVFPKILNLIKNDPDLKEFFLSRL